MPLQAFPAVFMRGGTSRAIMAYCCALNSLLTPGLLQAWRDAHACWG